jgi:DNA (cytosine-5)-methyltransferase 1
MPTNLIEDASSIEPLKKELLNTPFEGEELAVLTHYLNSGHTIPYVSEETYRNLSITKKINTPDVKGFKFIDLFAGIGGFRIALSRNGGTPVFSSEWNNTAQKIYYENYGDYPFGDINKFTNENVMDNELGALIPSHDILAGGFPCQPFSLAGVSARNSLGLEHGFKCKTQGTLFYSIERIARSKRPKILFLENVRNIVSHDAGKTFSIIKSTVEDLGYKFYHEIVNSETVVPQRRKRCFMVCVRKDLVEQHGEFNFPKFDGLPLPLNSIIEEGADEIYTISDKLWKGHQERSARNKSRGTGFTTQTADLNKPSNTIVARYGKDGKECLVPQSDQNPRMLTISECRNLFGYPEDFKLPKSRTPAYRLLGNSVVVPVVEKIAASIIDTYFSDGNIAL